jgi:nucleoside-diphosphate-sugar epimerase
MRRDDDVARTLVTGVAGFIGSTLADRLLDDGHEVVGVDSFEDYYPRPMKTANLAHAATNPGFTLIEGNLLDLGAPEAGYGCAPRVRDALARSDYVFHLAAQAGVRASWGRSFRTYVENNVLATQLLLEECKSADVKRLIYASSSSVYGDSAQLPLREDGPCRPHSPYGVTKLAGEHLCGLYWRNFEVPTVSLRFFTVYGPRQRPDMGFHRFIRAQLDGGEITVLGDGAQTRDFTYVDDIVNGLVAATQAQSGLVMNLGGGSRVSLMDALRTLEEATGMPVKTRMQPPEAGDVRHTWADVSLARENLSFAPKTSLKTGLRREYEWLCAIPAHAGEAGRAVT